MTRPKKTFYRSTSGGKAKRTRSTVAKRVPRRMVVRKPQTKETSQPMTGVGLRYGQSLRREPEVTVQPLSLVREPMTNQPDVVPKAEATPATTTHSITDVQMPADSLKNMHQEKQDQLSEINDMILSAKQRLQELTEQSQTQADVVDETQPEPADVEEFNGVSSPDERLNLLQEELEARRRAEMKMKKELEALKQVYEEEQEELKATIRTLKHDLHRTAPITEHKFFSLSKELGEAVKAINLLTTDTPVDVPLGTDGPITPVEVAPVAAVPAAAVAPAPVAKQVVAQPEAPAQPTAVAEAKPAEPAAPETEGKVPKKAKKKKMLITGGAAVIVLIALSAGLSMQLKGGPEVDEELVSQYLQTDAEKSGQVQGASTDQSPPDITNTGTVPGAVASDADKYAESQAEVTFADSVWEKLKDPMFGLELEYPANSVNIIKTDSSITFIRKTGYIFKISRVETGLELADYWKQIQATSLNYVPEDATVADQPAMHLVLQDTIDYPGNRYLVKSGDFIFDIWYATGGPKFTTDDVARAKRILDTVTFLE